MKITQAEVIQKLYDFWPNLIYTFLFDESYWMPGLYRITRIFDTSVIRGKSRPFKAMKYIPEFSDCDDFAQQFLAEVNRKRYLAYENGSLPEEQRWPVPGFCVAGEKFRGIESKHMVNLFLCREGFYFFDTTPVNDRYWEADPKKDDIYYVTTV